MIKDLKTHHDKEYVELLRDSSKQVFSFRGNGRIRQVDLYCYLHLKFGAPNGFQSFLRKDDSDNFIQWHYSFKHENIYFDVMASIRFLEFVILAKSKEVIEQISEDEIIKEIKDELKNNKEFIEEEKSRLESWDIFSNTYQRLKSTIDRFYQQYSSIVIDKPYPLLATAVTQLEANEYLKRLEMYTKSVNEIKNYGLVIRMLSPVVVESFINLIIFTLAIPEIKNDARVLDSIFRSNIDIRLKTLSVNCKGFARQVNQNDKRFKDFLALMNKRNDFLHGNIQPATNKFDHVYFEGTIPLFNEEKDLGIEFSSQALFLIEKEDIDHCMNVINGTRNMILELLEEPYKKSLSIILEKSILGWNNKKQRIGILFPDHLTQAIMIKNET